MGFFSRQPKPDLAALARAFELIVGVVVQSQKEKLSETVMLGNALAGMLRATGLPQPSSDRMCEFFALFIENQPRFRSVEMALLFSFNSFLGNRDLTQEDVAIIIRDCGRYENKEEEDET
jgi:hypothetical protein